MFTFAACSSTAQANKAVASHNNEIMANKKANTDTHITADMAAY
jgi:hypothetical protein